MSNETSIHRRPPIRCTPTRVTYDGKKYRVYRDGSVSAVLTFSDVDSLREKDSSLTLRTIQDIFEYEAKNLPRLDPHSQEARDIRRHASRLRRNRAARERTQAMKDLGMVRDGQGGWE